MPPPRSAPKQPIGSVSVDEEHIAFWIEKGLAYVELRVGKSNVGHIKLAGQVLIGLVLVWLALTLWKVIRDDPMKGRERKVSGKATGKNNKKEKNVLHGGAGLNHHQEEERAAGGGGSGVVETDNTRLANDIGAQVPSRSRKLNEVNHTSVIKGFSRCQMAHSPCGRYVVYGCQKAEKLHVHPMKYLRPRLGKELSSKGFLNLDANLEVSMGPATHGAAGGKNVVEPSKISIGAIGFSEDGNYCVLGECNEDTYHVFAVSDSVKSMTLKWSFKMPKGRYVSTAFDSIAVDNDGLNIYGFHKKNCEVEVLTNSQGIAGKERYKLGDATAWCHGGGDLICASGSYMHDIRMGTLSVKWSSVHLERRHCLNVAGTKIAAMSCTTQGVLAGTASAAASGGGSTSAGGGLMSTKSYLIAVDEKGVFQIFDLTNSYAGSDVEPQVISTFHDPDYDATITPANKCQGISWTMTGEPFHERLHIAVWNAMDATIYRQTPHSGNLDISGSSGKKNLRQNPMTFDFLQDIHSIHDGENVKALCFVNGGHGVMSISTGSSRGARMWDLQDATAPL